MEALTLGERVAVGEWEGLSLVDLVGVVLGVEVRVGACPEEEGLEEGRGEREGEAVMLGERLGTGEREGERVPVEEGVTLGEGEGKADREGERLELEVREGVRVEEVHPVREPTAVPERVPLGVALGQGLTVWDALGWAERVEVWLTVLLRDRRGENDTEPEKLALLEAEGAPLPLLDPATEASEDPVVFSGVGNTLGDTEWDMVALPDLLELGGRAPGPGSGESGGDEGGGGGAGGLVGAGTACGAVAGGGGGCGGGGQKGVVVGVAVPVAVPATRVLEAHLEGAEVSEKEREGMGEVEGEVVLEDVTKAEALSSHHQLGEREGEKDTEGQGDTVGLGVGLEDWEGEGEAEASPLPDLTPLLLRDPCKDPVRDTLQERVGLFLPMPVRVPVPLGVWAVLTMVEGVREIKGVIEG
jgi:hypothetical protein